MKDVFVNCSGFNFCDKNKDLYSLEEIIDLCEDLYCEVERLQETIEELNQDIEDNYKPISLKEQYGIDDSDFI
jgi:hypothetical protein